MRIRLSQPPAGLGLGLGLSLAITKRFWILSEKGVGVLDEIKALLSPTGAWAWAELGNNS